MSLFAKVLICLNAVGSIALLALLATSLAHKFDYKNLGASTHAQAESKKERLRMFRKESESAQQTAQLRYGRIVKDLQELAQANKSEKEKADELQTKRGEVQREVTTLESRKNGLDDKVKELQDKRTSLREEIAKLEKEREDNMAESRSFDQDRDAKIKVSFDLATNLREQEKALDKLGQRRLELERLWLYIVKNYPKLGLRVPMPEFDGAVTSVTGDIIAINRGRDAGAMPGGLIELSRPGTYVGTIELRNVSKGEAWGVLVERGPGAPARSGDTAKPTLPAGPNR